MKVAGLVAASLALALADPAHARWRKAETDHFVVFSDGEERGLRDYAVKLELFHELLAKRYPTLNDESVRKLPLYLVSRAGLRRVQPQAPDSLSGFYTADAEDIFAVAVRGEEGDQTVLHEYAHHFMADHFPAAYPGWLIEGYAEFFMTAEFGPREVTYAKFNESRAQWLVGHDWIPLAQLLSAQPHQLKNTEAVVMYYAQAWLLTHYMLLGGDNRQAQLSAYIKAVSGGADPVKAMEAATGQSLRDLEKDLRGYIKGRIRYATFPRSELGMPTVTVSELPPSADDLLLDNQLLKRERLIPDNQRAKVLARVREAAARHAGDRLAVLARARAEIALGDRSAGESVLRTWINANSTDAEALRLLAASRLHVAEQDADPKAVDGVRREALRLAVRAMRADQSDYQTLMLYARARFAEPNFPTDNDLVALVEAYKLAPQVGEIRLNTAQAMLARNRTAEAIVLLEPLVNDPHAGENASTARAVFEQAKAAAAAEGGKGAAR